MTRLFVKQLLISILPVIALAALSTIWITHVSEQQMLGLLKDELAVESRLHAARMRAFLDERLAELRAIAASPVAKSGDLDATLKYLADEHARLGSSYEGLYYNDLTGFAVSTNRDRLTNEAKKFSIADRPYFKQFQNGALVVTRVTESRDTKQEIVLIIVPLLDEHKRQIGGIAGAVKIGALLQSIESLLPADKGFATLVDGDRSIITKRTPQAGLRQEFLDWLQHAHEGVAEVDLGDAHYLLHLRNVPDSKWSFVLAKPRSAVTEKAVRVRYSNLLVAGIVLVVASLIAFFATRRLLDPISRLLAVCRRFGDGDWNARAENLPRDEIGDLGDAFNRTADQVASRYAAQTAAEQEVRESEARFRLLLNSIGEAVFLHDMNGKFLDVNDVACTSLGYTREELLTLTIPDIVPNVTPENLQQLWQRMKQDGAGFRREGLHRRKNGGEFPVEVNVVPLKTVDGMQVLASARDISARKRDEDKMAKFFRLSKDMMCIADTQGVFRQLSPAFEQVLGWPLEELLNKPYIDLVHPDDRQNTIEEANKVKRGEGAVNFENRYRCKNGSYRWLQWRPFREVDEGMVYAIARDVTESHRTTRLMSQTSAAAHVGGWEFDCLTGQLFWTDETYRLHDTTPEEYQPEVETALRFYSEEGRALIRAESHRAMQEGRPWSVEMELITAKGRRIWTHAVGQTDIEDGRPVRSYGSFQDITSRKKAEIERRLIDDQLREIQRVESIGILAGGIAHDFNNLLTGILGFTRLAISESGENVTMQSHLQQIENCSLRAADLCKQLLAYAGKGKFVIETLSLSDLVRDTAQLVETIFGSHAELELELDPELPLIEGDATQMRQVVMNLTTNAYDSLEGAPGKVTVRTGCRQIDQEWLQAAAVRGEIAPGLMVFVEVCDSGCGMDAETFSHIFDPFFTTKFAGRGLGLAAVQGIVRSHQGAVRVDSVVGKGSTFTLVFPPAEEPEESDQPAESIDRQETSLQPEGIGTILVIDDEASVRALAATALERGGYHVLLAENGSQGLEIFASEQNSLTAVLIDMTMPGMNGLEVARAIRERHATLPLLLMSGFTDVRLESKADQHLAAFVQKPFRLVELVDAVKAAIQSANNP